MSQRKIHKSTKTKVSTVISTTTTTTTNNNKRNTISTIKKKRTTLSTAKTKETISTSSPKRIKSPSSASASASVSSSAALSVSTSSATPKKLCTICTKSFISTNDLRKHLLIHSNERPHQCNQCDQRFRQAGCLKNHIACQHGTTTVFTCFYCNKTFPIKERLRLHMRIHSGERPYKCTICPKQFARGGQVTQHMVTHHNEWRKFNCSNEMKIKDQPTKTPEDISKSDNNDENTSDKAFVCEICGKKFIRHKALQRHLLNLHKNMKSVYCKICKKTLKGHLPQHSRIHQKNKSFNCENCGATFAQKSQLKVHQRMHSGERPYRCQVCWQAFGHSSVLKLHIRKHTGEKPFKCPLCLETETLFSQLPHLKTHMRKIHGMDKSYNCPGCNLFFKTKNELVDHENGCKLCDTIEGNGIGGVVSGDGDNTMSIINERKPQHFNGQDFSMMAREAAALTQMRLSVAVLLKKISNEKRLKELGFEKRLIDNVIVCALKTANKPYCDDKSLTETDRFRTNIRQFLEWTIPKSFMSSFERQQKSVEELLKDLMTAIAVGAGGGGCGARSDGGGTTTVASAESATTSTTAIIGTDTTYGPTDDMIQQLCEKYE